LADCANILDDIESRIQRPEDRVLYAHRYALLTRAEIAARQDGVEEALEYIRDVLSLSETAGDHLLNDIAQLAGANLLFRANRIPEAVGAMYEVAPRLIERPPDLHAHYECVLAGLLAANGHEGAGRAHYDRAERIYRGLGNQPGLVELAHTWDSAVQQAAATAHDTPAERLNRDPVQETLQTAAGLLLHSGRPELVAREMVHLLEATQATCGAAALSRGKAGDVELLATSGRALDTATDAAGLRRFTIGTARDRQVEVLVAPRDSLEAAATVNAVAQLLSIVREMERARAEREDRLSLWPIDETPLEPGQPVVSGRMRELMALARRIATTRVGVLITGESGTGKEILARTIHEHSPRAEKPFVPFNCAAVPREMLESQLFGHRRGAFTGADRDNPGVIRSADGGTLFLDEIGELGLDLQPKLLRFLESGEILPLGESTPVTVDARIVAATNAGLEQLVREHRFREDLFYRLNIVRLEVPPLRERRDEIPALVQHFVRRAADEYAKRAVRLSEASMEQVLLYDWPGNIRQLQNELRRVIAIAEPDAVITPDQLAPDIAAARPPRTLDPRGFEIAVPLTGQLGPTLEMVEREMIQFAMRQHHGRIEAVAGALGLSRKGLYLKRQRLGL
jgi:DNA-binding NtrC family response regulator